MALIVEELSGIFYDVHAEDIDVNSREAPPLVWQPQTIGHQRVRMGKTIP